MIAFPLILNAVHQEGHYMYMYVDGSTILIPDYTGRHFGMMVALSLYQARQAVMLGRNICDSCY